LPPTSIRDLVIHQDDVIVGTHGRSFWILDNISPLRELNASIAGSQVHFFAPQIAYRIRRNNNTDTPLPPEVPAGRNPPDGAMLDYYLKSAASGPVTLEIFDDSGKLVRRFSSTDKPRTLEQEKMVVPSYWVRPPQALSTEPGLHRFVWDLHYPPPDSITREYPISAIYHDTPLYPLGATALPTKYLVKLTVNGSSYTQPLTIRMDPRVKTPLDGLRKQFVLESKITDLMHRDYEALQQVRDLRSQLKDLKQRTSQGSAREPLSSLEKKAGDLEGDEGGYGARFLSTPEGRSLARLNAGLFALLQAVDSADTAPTTAAATTFEDVEQALSEQLALWNEIKAKDIPNLNTLLRQTGTPPVTVP
jgi:hypothetical protein